MSDDANQTATSQLEPQSSGQPGLSGPKQTEQEFSLEKTPMTLSQYVAAKGFVSRQVMLEFKRRAAVLARKSKKTKEESNWLTDYLVRSLEVEEIDLQEGLGALNVGSAMDRPISPNHLSDANSVNDYNQVFDGFQDTSTPKKPLAIKLNELVIKPDTFDGYKPPARRWLDDYERASEANSWSQEIMVKYFPTFIEKSALDWYITIAKKTLGAQASWQELRACFIRHYLGDSDRQFLRRQVERLMQGEKEPAAVFIPRALRLYSLVEPDKLVDAIRDKLRGIYQDKLALYNIYTIQSLNDACRKIECGVQAAKNANFRERKSDEEKKGRKNDRVSKSSGKSFDKKRDNNPKSGQQKNSSSGNSSDAKKRTCYRCERSGHIAKDCHAKAKANCDPCNPKKDKPSSINIVQEDTPSTSSPQSKPEEDTRSQVRAAGLNHLCTITTGLLVETKNEQLITANIKCNGKMIAAIADSGAARSVVNANVARQLGWKITKWDQPLHHAAGGKLNIAGQTMANLELQLGKRSKSTSHQLLAIEDLCADFILGIDLLKILEINVSPFKKEPLWFDKEDKGVRTPETITLPGRSLNLIYGVAHTDAKEVTCAPFTFDTCLAVAHSIGRVEHGRTPVLIANMDRCAVELRANQQIASYEQVAESNITCPSVNALLQLEDTSDFVHIGDCLTSSQVLEIKKVIQENIQAFSVNNSIGRTQLIEHSIELEEGAKAFREPVRRHPRVHEVEAARQVKDMLERDFIEESSSPFASEYVLVKKKGGEWRMCIDYRRLNSITKKNSYPLPNIETCLESLGGKKFFSKLDFASGYWQVPISDNSRELTAFRAAGGLYQYKVMPFGLTNAPASFQKLMDMMFAGLRGETLQTFLDDICLATSSFEEHLELLRRVLKIIIKANLKLKGAKCLFATDEIVYLGHRISQDGIHQDASKMVALKQLPAPQDKSEVRRVLGAFGYYRRFVPNFALLSAPLTKLTRKDSEFTWGEEQQKAFEQLKNELLSHATLAYFSNDAETLLKTDASKQGIAGILLQNINGQWKMVSCCSRRLQKAEENYSITEIEGLAIVYSCQKFRPYLLGRKFEILTDHCALCSLATKMSSNARLRRWALVLSEYDFKIRYTRGSLHQDVDCLSRAPITDEPDDFLDKLLLIPLDASSWADYADDESQKVLEMAMRAEKGFTVVDGLIYQRNRLYVPPSKRELVMRQSHDEGYAGHDGVEGTLGRMAEFYWQTQRGDVESYVRGCKLCQLRKAEQALPAGTMQSFHAVSPGALVCFDFLELNKESISGARFVLVGVDVFTRYVTAKASSNMNADTFLRSLNEYCATFGPPETIVTDNAKAFDNAAVKELEGIFGIKHQFAAPRHHRGNSPAERVIRVIQEKLSLVIAQHDSRLDWEAALPMVVLSHNTKIHSATRFTPFQLMFGRAARPVQQCATRSSTVHDMHNQIVQSEAERMRADAVANTSEAQLKSQKYFDQQNREVNFKVGDKVLTKRTERRAKLSDRFEGPFEVIAVDKDIYKLRDSKNTIRVRHVSALKRFTEREMIVQLILLTVTTSSAAGFIIEEAPPVIHELDTNKFVVQETAAFAVELYEASACDALLQYPQLQQPQLQQKQQQAPRLLQVQHPPQAQAQQRASVIQPQVPVQQQAQRLPPVILTAPVVAGPTAGHGEASEEPGDDQPEQPSQGGQNGIWVSREEAESLGLRPRRSLHEIQQHANCEAYHRSQVTNLLADFNHGRERRQLEFLAGLAIASAIGIHHFDNKLTSLEDRQRFIEEQLKTNIKQNGLVILSQKALGQAIKGQQNQIKALETNLGKLASAEEIYSVIISHITTRHELLQRMRISIDQGQPDLVALSELLGGRTQFGKVRIGDITKLIITSPRSNTLLIKMFARIRSETTQVYKVSTFSFISNVHDQPTRMDYIGHQLLIRNHKLDCVKGITSTILNYVEESCDEPHFRDPNLRKWRRTPIKSLTNTTHHSQMIVAYPHLYVYCWGNEIMVKDGAQFVNTSCPSYVCKFSIFQTIKTSDGLVSHTGTDQVVREVHKFRIDVLGFHFEKLDYEPAHRVIEKALNISETHLAKATRLQEELELFTWNSHVFTAKHLAIGSWGLCISFVVIGAIVVACRNLNCSCRVPQLTSREQIRREVHAEVAHELRRQAPVLARAMVGEIELRSHPRVLRNSIARPALTTRRVSQDTVSCIIEEPS